MSLLRAKLEGQTLSPPELEVLESAAAGLSAAETARTLIKSEHTIVSHRRALQAKLGARNLPHAVAIAYQLRLLPVPSREPNGSRRRREEGPLPSRPSPFGKP
jgi:DNA-binding CsgD family transcriptional regulator